MLENFTSRKASINADFWGSLPLFYTVLATFRCLKPFHSKEKSHKYVPKDELRSSVLKQLAPFCLPIWITECSFVKFANKFSESLLGTDSVNFSLICLLFGAKGIAEINRTLVKT